MAMTPPREKSSSPQGVAEPGRVSCTVIMPAGSTNFRRKGAPRRWVSWKLQWRNCGSLPAAG